MAVPKKLDALKARSECCGLFHLATPEGGATSVYDSVQRL
jgi:hypothetical protein